jgi:hypothetical protein
MSNIRCSINITETDDQISGRILRALKTELDKFLSKIFDRVKPQIVTTVQKAVVSSPEYNSLLSGDLKYEFGLPDSDSRVQTILNFWTKINVEYKKVSINNNTKLAGGFILTMIPSDYSDVLSSSAAVFTTEKGTDLNWLEWLLLFGSKTIIRDYEVEFGYNPKSRTGQAIMRGVKRGKWSVPSQFSGTQNNNWITRAIDSVESDIYKILSEAMKK